MTIQPPATPAETFITGRRSTSRSPPLLPLGRTSPSLIALDCFRREANHDANRPSVFISGLVVQSGPVDGSRSYTSNVSHARFTRSATCVNPGSPRMRARRGSVMRKG